MAPGALSKKKGSKSSKGPPKKKQKGDLFSEKRPKKADVSDDSDGSDEEVEQLENFDEDSDSELLSGDDDPLADDFGVMMKKKTQARILVLVQTVQTLIQMYLISSGSLELLMNVEQGRKKMQMMSCKPILLRNRTSSGFQQRRNLKLRQIALLIFRISKDESKKLLECFQILKI
ncbi:unnamed protein product [Linum tenue]|uniref:Uncharacterized protein n=1 Tax=Linum tenue TaxID=586396 RepID=A0AAV0GMF5_9ROSI|nr:unnamed protein product [Linum tenue]